MNTILEEFIRSARWFGGKGRDFRLTGRRRAGVLPACGDGPGVAIDLVELTYDDGDIELYQLPLAFRPVEDGRLAHALVGVWNDDDFGDCHVYDAVHDRDAMALWLSAFADVQPDSSSSRDLLVFHRLPGHEIDTTTHSTLFSGEQSNSSVAFGDDCLMKVFRKVTPGVNPDIQIHHVLTEAGSDHVAALYGWLDTVDEASDSVIQLAMLEQFLRTGADGWELAQSSVRNLYAEADLHADEVGGDFAGESDRLGVALAETHQVLAEAFPTENFDTAALGELATAMAERLDAAVVVVPDLVPHVEHLKSLYARFATLDDLAVQRIHGDLHLGQTLRAPDRWIIIDFEGEPAAPLAERRVPDSPARDVAGILRSLDYAAQHTLVGVTDRQLRFRAREWRDRNVDAFCTGYAEVSDTDPRETGALLRAYTLDKALYEVVYESRNRPGWVAVPMGAVERILHSD